MPKVFVGLPTYNGQNDARLGLNLYAARLDTNLIIDVKTKQLSALCWNFNHLWARVLNDKTYDYFILVHADIVPTSPRKWINKLIADADSVKADCISVVSPLKNPDGLTSTALMSNEHPNGRRLAMRELAKLPDVFTDLDLAKVYGWENDGGVKMLINTGLMLMDLRRNRPIWEQMYFKTVDRIEKRDGKFVETFFPEDWDWSLQCYTHYLKVAATKSITLMHNGLVDYPNDKEWGTKEADI